MIFPEKWKCIIVYWAIMVKMKSKQRDVILILPRIENIYTYETIEIRLLLTCYRSIGSIVYTQGRRLGSDQDGLSGNNRSAAGRLGRRDDEKLQRLVDFHREDFGFMKFENEWCEIVVPSESPNKLYIALKENDGREPRKIGIGMTVGDAFTSIDITQGSALLTTPNE